MVDTGCPRAGYRHIAFHSRGCVEPQRSGGEERAARVLVWRHVIQRYIIENTDFPTQFPYHVLNETILEHTFPNSVPISGPR